MLHLRSSRFAADEYFRPRVYGSAAFMYMFRCAKFRVGGFPSVSLSYAIVAVLAYFCSVSPSHQAGGGLALIRRRL